MDGTESNICFTTFMILSSLDIMPCHFSVLLFQGFQRMQGAGSGVGLVPVGDFAFDVGVHHLADIALETGTIFAQIVPTTSQLGPIGSVERGGKYGGEFSGIGQVLRQKVIDRLAVDAEFAVGKKLSNWGSS